MISEQISKDTRFRSLGASCTGNPASSISYLEGGIAAAERSAAGFAVCAHLRTGLHRSERRHVHARSEGHGQAQRACPRSPTSVRRSSAISARKTARVSTNTSPRCASWSSRLKCSSRSRSRSQACVRPKAPEECKVSDQIDVTINTHKIMGKLLAHALLCDQTRSIRMMFSDSEPEPSDPRRLDDVPHVLAPGADHRPAGEVPLLQPTQTHDPDGRVHPDARQLQGRRQHAARPDRWSSPTPTTAMRSSTG